MSKQALAILESAMISSVGLTAPASCAAIRCGIDNIQETGFRDARGEWIMGCEVPLEKSLRDTKKLAIMLATVLRESVSQSPDLVLAEIPILFCLAEEGRPGRFMDLENRILHETQQALRISFHKESILVAQGQASLAIAMQQATQLVHNGKTSQVIIAGVDSLLVGSTLRAYEAQGRLLTSQNSNGFIPGEAASAVLVGLAAPDGGPQLLCLGTGMGVEEATPDSGRALRADGLVSAIKAALAEAGCGLEAIDLRIADLSGDQYSFKEASLAMTRVLRVRREEFDLWHPADCIGEVGAAIGTVILTVCLQASRKGYAPGKKMLCHLASENGKRAAIVLSYESPGGRNGQ